MYAKLVEGNLKIAPKMLPADGVNVWNPPAEMYAEAGYKPVAFTDEPEVPGGYHLEAGWEEKADAVVQAWALVEDPEEELAAEEIVAAIEEALA